MDNTLDLYTLFIQPLSYAFMQRALLAAVLVGAVSGVVGSFVVVRGMAFLGDALAHSILPGVALAFIGGNALFIGGLVAGVLAALGIGWLTRGERLKEDTAIGIVFAGMFALGIAIISTARSYSVDLTHILFGNVLGVSNDDLLIMAGCGTVVLGTILLLYKEFLVISFDPGLARTLKLPAEPLRLTLIVLTAVAIVASLQMVGVALMIAMLLTPAATAQLLVKRMHHMMLLAGLLGTLCGIAGLYLSYHLNVPSGTAIVLTATALFALVFALTTLRERLGSHTA